MEIPAVAPRRDEINEFFAKVTGLQELLGFKNNFDRFCVAIGLSREGLRACLYDQGTRGLSGEYQRAVQEVLSDRLGEFLRWPEWIEPDRSRIARGQRRDTASAFLEKCQECLRQVAGRHSSEGLLTNTQLRLVIADNLPPIVESLGSIEVFATDQFVEGRDGMLSGTLICRPANLEGVRIAVRFCKLRLVRNPIRQEAASGTRAKPIVPVPNDKNVEVTIERVGTSQRPTVEVKAAVGAIEMVSLPDDLWPVSAPKANDRFEAQLLVYLRDCRLVDDGETAESLDEEMRAEDGSSFIGPGRGKLGQILKLIEKRLEECRLLDSEEGFGVLHRFAVELIPVNPTPIKGSCDEAT